LKLADVQLNRKALSEMAIREPDDFDAIVAMTKQTLEANPAASGISKA
jgi:ribosomal protein L20